MTVAGAIIAIVIPVALGIVAGEWLSNGARELFDQPRSDRTDGLSLGGSDNLKTSFHSSANSGEAQHDHA